MLPSVKWWRAKTETTLDPRRAAWFEQANAYPGFVVMQSKPNSCVRLFRDLEAFKSHDGSYSVDLPLDSLDEVPDTQKVPAALP